MSDTSSLSQLARFVGQSALSNDPGGHQGVADAMGALALKPQRRNVADLLGVVLALSARTRRMVLPQASIDLDVFCPDGSRAVRLILPVRG